MTPPPPTRRADHDASDPDLVDRARSGDRLAFAELYRRHAPAVARLARARAADADADDAVAETFARAWASLDRYRDTGAPFVSWLYGIGRNVISDGHRKQARVTLTAEVDDVGVYDADDRHLTLLELGSAITKLKRRQRRVIELKYLAGLNNDEVAGALGITPGAVNTLQWRALRRLETMMGESR